MKVKVNIKNKATNSLMSAQDKAMIATAQEILNRVRNDQLIPYKVGTLQNESTYVDTSKVREGLVTIVSDTKYALRLYMHPEYNFQTGKNANAGAGWWDQYLPGGEYQNVPLELFKTFYKKFSGGYVQ